MLLSTCGATLPLSLLAASTKWSAAAAAAPLRSRIEALSRDIDRSALAHMQALEVQTQARVARLDAKVDKLLAIARAALEPRLGATPAN